MSDKRLNFSAINNLQVGYKLNKVGDRPNGASSDTEYSLNVLKFKDFIQVYAGEAENYSQVYANLENALNQHIENQDSGVDKKTLVVPKLTVDILNNHKGYNRLVTLDEITEDALQREAIRTSMKLIAAQYLHPLAQ